MRVLLTGSTGFVGSHVHPQLAAAGFDVLCGTRDPERASERDPSRHFCRLDLFDSQSIVDALHSVDAAVYLVHSMGADGERYAKVEEESAERFRMAAHARGLERIVYLGGMRPRGAPSKHLASRLHVGDVLRRGSVRVVELEATMIVGGGSESFRIVRDLAARLPFMLLPKWLGNRSEPVGIRDVGAAIVHALQMALPESRTFTLPGPEALSGRDILVRTARLLGQNPHVVNIPLVTPRLSSYWIRLVTRSEPHVAAELVEGLLSDILSRDDDIWADMPEYRRTSFDDAVRSALKEEATALPTSTLLMERAMRSLAPTATGRKG